MSKNKLASLVLLVGVIPLAVTIYVVFFAEKTCPGPIQYYLNSSPECYGGWEYAGFLSGGWLVMSWAVSLTWLGFLWGGALLLLFGDPKDVQKLLTDN